MIMHRLAFFASLLFSLAPLAAQDETPAIVPGAVLTLEYPDLGYMRKDVPVAMEVSIPAGFDPARPTPLLVWISGGFGSHSVSGARGLVDFDKYVVVALPFPDGRSPVHAAKAGELEGHRELALTLLDRVRELLPNLDPRVRYVAGTSNGGHLIGYAIDQAWPGFANYFSHFVIHEGGASPLTHRMPAARDKRILFVYGEESPSLIWCTWFAWNLEQSKAAATIVGLPGSGHGFDAPSRARVREWIASTSAQALVTEP